MALNTRIQTKRDTAANWETNNPVLLDGELIIVDTNAGDTRFKIGDGTKTYTQLPFQDESLYSVLSSKADSEDVDTALSNKADTADLEAVQSSIGNGTITITQNGTTKGSFTMNQSGNATIALTDTDTNTTYSAATTSTAGLLSASDKSKLDGIATGATKVTVDSALSSTSTNPVQNKLIYAALADKADLSDLENIQFDIDDALSSTSTNPVQNKVIYDALYGNFDCGLFTDTTTEDSFDCGSF